MECELFEVVARVIKVHGCNLIKSSAIEHGPQGTNKTDVLVSEGAVCLREVELNGLYKG